MMTAVPICPECSSRRISTAVMCRLVELDATVVFCRCRSCRHSWQDEVPDHNDELPSDGAAALGVPFQHLALAVPCDAGVMSDAE